MTHRAPASDAERDRLAAALPVPYVAVTRSESPHPADWGRAVSLALEYLAEQVAFTERKPEPGILIGRTVHLRFDANGRGAVIRAELDDPRLPARPAVDETERALRNSIGYGFGEYRNPDDVE